MKQHRLDFDRRSRIGLDEAIFCAPKSVEQIRAILDDAQDRGARMLLTRLAADKARRLGELDYDEVSQTAYFGPPSEISGEAHVVVATGGTGDIGVALEAVRTLAFDGHKSLVLPDMGVAGLWRLTDQIERLSRYPVIIAVAGMDAAMPTVLAGLVPSVVIAVPTSTGYGAARGGETALASCLSSCASGLVVVNIDNGYGAACAAMRFLNASNLGSNQP